MKKTIYLVLTIIGFIFPYYFVAKFYIANDMSLTTALAQVTANQMGALIAADLTISVLAAWTFIYNESKKLGMKNWWLFLVATGMVGLSFALPLFLYFRERHLETKK